MLKIRCGSVLDEVVLHVSVSDNGPCTQLDLARSGVEENIAANFRRLENMAIRASHDTTRDGFLSLEALGDLAVGTTAAILFPLELTLDLTSSNS